MATTKTRSRDRDDAPQAVIDTDDIAQLKAGRALVIQLLQEAQGAEAFGATTLQAHIAMTPASPYRRILERHLRETRDQSERLSAASASSGSGARSSRRASGRRPPRSAPRIALGKGPIDLLRGRAGEEKLFKNVKDEVTTEAQEIVTYEGIEAAAHAVGDVKTAELAASIRDQEQKAFDDLREQVPVLAGAAVRSLVAGDSSYDLSKTGAVQAARTVRDEAVGEAEELVDDARDASKAAASRTRSTARKATASARRTARSAEKSAAPVDPHGVVLDDGSSRSRATTSSTRRGQREALRPHPRRAAQGRGVREEPREAHHGARADQVAQERVALNATTPHSQLVPPRDAARRAASLEDDDDHAGIDRLSRHYMGAAYGNREQPRVNAWIDVDRWHAWVQAGRGGRRRDSACGTLCGVDLIERLLAIDVSALSDADKTLPVVDPAVRAMIPDVRMAGPGVHGRRRGRPSAGDERAGRGRARRRARDRRERRRRAPSSASCSRPRRAGAGSPGSSPTASAATCGACARSGCPVFARGTTPRSGTTVSRAAPGADDRLRRHRRCRRATSCSATTTAC